MIRFDVWSRYRKNTHAVGTTVLYAVVSPRLKSPASQKRLRPNPL